ncbi:hypothetical protein M3Y96_01203600 [Aphelenchoides besseyi]|nr:hypothetical protein M3Y96_01203600 [Aphelenchoides besseyi]
MVIRNSLAFGYGRVNTNDPRLYDCVCNEHTHDLCYICYYNGDVKRLKSDYKRYKYALGFLYLFLVLVIVGINVAMFTSMPGSIKTKVPLPVISFALLFLLFTAISFGFYLYSLRVRYNVLKDVIQRQSRRNPCTCDSSRNEICEFCVTTARDVKKKVVSPIKFYPLFIVGVVVFLLTIICTVIITLAFIYVISNGILAFTAVALIIFIVVFVMGLLMILFQGCGLYGALHNYRNGRTALKQVIQRSSNPPIYSVS